MGQIAELIVDVLEGRKPKEALGPCWKADLSTPIYEKACKILELPLESRKAEIEKHCELVAMLLKEEVTRLYRYRKHAQRNLATTR